MGMVAASAKPPDVERPVVIVVVGLRLWLAAPFAGGGRQAAGLHCSENSHMDPVHQGYMVRGSPVSSLGNNCHLSGAGGAVYALFPSRSLVAAVANSRRPSELVANRASISLVHIASA